jgi:hypothetical protein
MRKPHRFRRFPWLAIPLLTLTIVSVQLLLRSREHCERITLGRFGFFLDAGVTGFAAYTDDARNRPTREHWRHGDTWYWKWLTWGRTDNTSFSAMFSAWPIPIITGLASCLWVVFWARRVRSTRCMKCGYDLSRCEPDTGCPECGLHDPKHTP